jgi:hypothetical protein
VFRLRSVELRRGKRVSAVKGEPFDGLRTFRALSGINKESRSQETGVKVQGTGYRLQGALLYALCDRA